MSEKKHNAENKGANPRDLVRPHRHFWKNAHRDWRVWIAVTLMLAMILVYVFTNDFSLAPGKRIIQQMPANNAP
jgi:hypothetical protein